MGVFSTHFVYPISILASIIIEEWNNQLYKLWFFASYRGLPLVQFSEFNNFLWVCGFLCKNLSNFLYLVWKLHNPYCHSVHYLKKREAIDGTFNSSKNQKRISVFKRQFHQYHFSHNHLVSKFQWVIIQLAIFCLLTLIFSSGNLEIM